LNEFLTRELAEDGYSGVENLSPPNYFFMCRSLPSPIIARDHS